MDKVDAAIARLRADLNASTDSELASLLGLGRSAVSQWRKRGAIPDRVVALAAQVAAHLKNFSYASQQVASLSDPELSYARALAVAFIYRQASAGPESLEVQLPRLAGAFDAITVAAARAMREWGLDQMNAFGTTLLEPNLERAMTRALLPTLLPQKLPQ